MRRRLVAGLLCAAALAANAGCTSAPGVEARSSDVSGPPSHTSPPATTSATDPSHASSVPGAALSPSDATGSMSTPDCQDVTGLTSVTEGVLSAGPFSETALTLPAGAGQQKMWVSSQRSGTDDAVLTVVDPHGDKKVATRRGGEASIPTAKQFFPGTIPLSMSGTYTISVRVGTDEMCFSARYSVG